MRSFIVSVLVESLHEPELDMELRRWMEVAYIVDADNEADASAQGVELAKEYESEYTAMDGDHVKWKVGGVAGIWSVVQPLQVNQELFCRFLRATEAKSLLSPFED